MIRGIANHGPAARAGPGPALARGSTFNLKVSYVEYDIARLTYDVVCGTYDIVLRRTMSYLAART